MEAKMKESLLEKDHLAAIGKLEEHPKIDHKPSEYEEDIFHK